MTEQQQHLKDLLIQQKELTEILNQSSTKLNETRDNFLRIDGAIQYLTRIVGVELSEPEDNNSETLESEEN
jgi:hypothetical protein